LFQYIEYSEKTKLNSVNSSDLILRSAADPDMVILHIGILKSEYKDAAQNCDVHREWISVDRAFLNAVNCPERQAH